MTVFCFVEPEDELSAQAVGVARSLGDVRVVAFAGAYQPRAFSVNVERVRTEAVAVVNAPEIGIARVLISIDIVLVHARL